MWKSSRKSSSLTSMSFATCTSACPNTTLDPSLQLLIIIDTVFIYEFLIICMSKPAGYSNYLYILFYNVLTMRQTWRDFVLIENQIPVSFLKTTAIKVPKKPKFT